MMQLADNERIARSILDGRCYKVAIGGGIALLPDGGNAIRTGTTEDGRGVVIHLRRGQWWILDMEYRPLEVA